LAAKLWKKMKQLLVQNYSAKLLSEEAKTDVCAILNHEVIGIFLVLE
jgi:hypothetical protein